MLDFEIQFLTVASVKRPILHQHTKFSKDRSNHREDIAFFVISQDGGCTGPICVVVPNFIKICQRLQRYGDLTVF